MERINYREICVCLQCPFCGKGHEVRVNEMDYLDWENGMLTQNAFPYLTATEREQLISHLCPTCQTYTFFGTIGKEE